MPQLIQDEFTMLPLSAARKYQLRHERDGLCRLCPRPAEPGLKPALCPEHRARQKRCERIWVGLQRDPASVI